MMNWRAGVLGACVAVSLLFAAPTIAPAEASNPITGKLAKPGYTVIAIAANGKARAARAGSGKFKLRPPAASVTLHLRAPDGSYAGPIVIGRAEKGKRAILGVKAGAKLGRVELKLRKGYAKLKGKLAGKWVDKAQAREARAKKGVPIGAGKDGLVRSKKAKGGVPGDSDLDGIPNSLDIDDDGDLILDDYDRSTNRATTRSASQSDLVGVPFLSGSFLDITTTLNGGGVNDAVNVNGGSSDEQIAEAQRSGGTVGALWTGVDPGSGELDCGTLVYCSKGGTGRFVEGPSSTRETAPQFPECCDSDGDGRGSLTATQFGGGGGGVRHMSLFHGATDDQIRAGDVLIEHATLHGAPTQFVSTVGFVYSTMPVLAAYSDGQGNSSTFSYPRAMCAPGQVFAPGSSCPAPVRAGPNGKVVVTMTFWRPQRRRIEGEAGEGKWMDIGNLVYGETVSSAGFGAPGGFCPQSSYSAVDPNLTLLPPTRSSANPPVQNGARYGDLIGDQPSNSANTFTFTLDLTDCLASKGLSMNALQPVVANLTALSENDDGPIFMATSNVNFFLQP